MKKRFSIGSFFKKAVGLGLATSIVVVSGASAFAAEVTWEDPNASVSASDANSLKDPRIKEFSDVPKEHFAKESIEFASMWLMQGTGDGKFHPEGILTRAQAVQILRNASHSTPIKTNAAFSDVKPGEWYYEALSFAVQEKLCQGFPDGSFRPEKELTYEEFAVMIFNYMKRQYPVWFESNKYGGKVPKYGKYSEFSKAALEFAEFLVKPANPEQKDATKPITRAEAAIFIHKAESTQLTVFRPAQ